MGLVVDLVENPYPLDEVRSRNSWWTILHGMRTRVVDDDREVCTSGLIRASPI
jgi:hypothetical protein